MSPDRRHICTLSLAQILQDCETYKLARELERVTKQRDELLAAAKGLATTVNRLRIAYVLFPHEQLSPNPVVVEETWQAAAHFIAAIANCEQPKPE